MLSLPKIIIGVIAIILLIRVIKKVKNKTKPTQVYTDKTIKNHKRWHK